MNVADALRQLADPTQSVRDAAAAALRSELARDPGTSGDPGKAFWKKKLAEIKPGLSAAEFERVTGGQSEGAVSSGQSTTSIVRLDDYWTVVAYCDRTGTLREIGPLSRSARRVWVQPPRDFSGRWVTYFVNGVVAHDIQYAKGTYERFTSYYDNGQLVSEQRYVGGAVDGTELGYHRDGTKAYEIHHALGKSVGRWIHWYPDGTLQSEATYVAGMREGPSIEWRADGTKSSRFDYRAGKETGQAAWDKHGKLLYARGTAEQNPDET